MNEATRLQRATQEGLERGATQVKTSEVQSLVERHLPQPYRFYRDFVPQQALQTLAKARVRRLVEKLSDDIVLYQEMQRILGAGGWRTLPVETSQFGFGAARIDFLVSDGNYRESCKIRTWLLEKILEACKGRDVKHIIIH